MGRRRTQMACSTTARKGCDGDLPRRRAARWATHYAPAADLFAHKAEGVEGDRSRDWYSSGHNGPHRSTRTSERFCREAPPFFLPTWTHGRQHL